MLVPFIYVLLSCTHSQSSTNMLWKLFTVSEDTKFTNLRCRATTTITFVPTNLIRLKRLSKESYPKLRNSHKPAASVRATDQSSSDENDKNQVYHYTRCPNIWRSKKYTGDVSSWYLFCYINLLHLLSFVLFVGSKTNGPHLLTVNGFDLYLIHSYTGAMSLKLWTM